MCMVEQILESWVVSDHVCFVTCGFSPMFRSCVFGLCFSTDFFWSGLQRLCCRFVPPFFSCHNILPRDWSAAAAATAKLLLLLQGWSSAKNVFFIIT
jgi:hypothetical protein